MKRIISILLSLSLCLLCCVPALAAVGDRTLLHQSTSDGYMSSFVQAAFVLDDGFYLILGGEKQTVQFFSDTAAEPVVCTLDSDNDMITLPAEEGDEEGSERTAWQQIAAWFAWQGSVYALQYRTISGMETSEVEGGFIKRLVIADGQAKLEDCDLPQLDWTDMVEDYGGWKGSRSLNSTMVIGNSLLGQTWDANGQQLWMSFDLTTGMAEQLSLPEVERICQGPDDSLFLLRSEYADEASEYRTKVSRYSLSDASEEPVGATAYLDELCCDPNTGSIVFARGGQIWVAKDMNLDAAEAVTDCPIPYDIHLVPLKNNTVLIWSNSTVVTRNLDPDQQSALTLKIQDYGYAESLSEAVYEYQNRHGDVTVLVQRTGETNQILQAMMNQSAEVDIYTLTYHSSEFDALRNRGYLADLSGNADLVSAFDRMQPFLRDALIRDGKIVAVPENIYGNALGIQMDIWKKLGGTEEELPATWNQFFDWLETLPAKLEGTDYSVFGNWMTRVDFRYSMLTTLMNQYQQYLNSSDSMAFAFNTPLLQGLLSRMDALDYDALGLQEQNPEGEDDGGMWEYHEPLLDIYGQVTVASWSNASQPLPLAFEEGTSAIMPVTLTVAFVNPWSAHQAEAAEYLAESLNNLSTSVKYSVFTDEAEPLHYPNYAENLAALEKYAEEARAMLETATDEDRAMLEELVASYDEQLANYENENWMISPQNIASYQANIPYIEVLSYDFASAMVSSENDVSTYYELVDGYAQHQISPEELLSTIDRKVQMMKLEGN